MAHITHPSPPHLSRPLLPKKKTVGLHIKSLCRAHATHTWLRSWTKKPLSHEEDVGSVQSVKLILNRKQKVSSILGFIGTNLFLKQEKDDFLTKILWHLHLCALWSIISKSSWARCNKDLTCCFCWADKITAVYWHGDSLKGKTMDYWCIIWMKYL